MDRILKILKEYGFTESEVKVYTTLLNNGALTGYEAAKKSGVSRSKVYDVLQNLLNKGLVMNTTNDKSSLYMAQSYKKLTKMLECKVKKDVDTLNEEFNHYKTNSENELIWNVSDISMVNYKTEELISKAKNNIYIQIWRNELTETLEDLILKRESEGIMVVVVLYDTDNNYKTRLKNVYPHGFEEEKIKELSERWINISIDNNEMIYASIKNKKNVSGIYTKNKSMVFFATEYIMHDIYCLKLIEDIRSVDFEKSKLYIEEIRKVFEK